MLSLEHFTKELHLLEQNPKDYKYLLALSGGADSMVLANLFFKSKLNFEVAHINYHLRGEDSILDEEVVKRFCLNRNIVLHQYSVSEKDKKPKNSIQNWARNIRYQFFREIVNTNKLNFIVTAHHLHDQLETFIINLSKASGIRGLSGIPSKENGILRPLLRFSKEHIYDFAKRNEIEYREDTSNQNSHYLRNKIRNQIAPLLTTTHSHFLDNFSTSISLLKETRKFVEDKIRETQDNLTIKNEKFLILDKEKFALESDFIQFEILRDFGFKNRKELHKIFSSETGSSFFSKEYQLIIHRNELILKPIFDTIIPEEIPIKYPCTLDTPVSICIEESHEKVPHAQWIFDQEKLFFPLKLRKKKSGDRFQPLGMEGRKKVSKYFKDEKFSSLEKEGSWLLCDAKDRVLGVIPHRQDGSYFPTENTSKFISIYF